MKRIKWSKSWKSNNHTSNQTILLKQIQIDKKAKYSQTRSWCLYTKAMSTKWIQYVCLVIKEDLNRSYLPRLPTKQDVVEGRIMWSESKPVGLGKISSMTPHTRLSTYPDTTPPFSITSSGLSSARRQTIRQVSPNRLKRQIWTELCQKMQAVPFHWLWKISQHAFCSLLTIRRGGGQILQSLTHTHTHTHC